MKVNLNHSNKALISIIENPSQIITLDANILIAPDRSSVTNTKIGFEKFKKYWLDPIFHAFPNLALHEAVHEEILESSVRNYLDIKMNSDPPKMIIHRDSSLTELEKSLRDTVEAKIVPHTKYEPLIDNKADKGEVKSLCYIAVKELLYFAAHDNNAIQLIEKSKEWSTGLDNVQAIKMYELIYYLYKSKTSDKDAMRMFYKYYYYLTNREKSTNPNWGDFLVDMENLYKEYDSFFNS